MANSHLMPEDFGRDIRGSGKDFWIGTGDRPGRLFSQSGVFDRFLCRSHEAMTQASDDYAIKFIRGFNLSESEVTSRRFRRDGTDNEALIRFVCTVLWRFHQSDRPEASGVDLGEWEPNMRSITFGGSIHQAPDVVMRAIHFDVATRRDAFLLAPASGLRWGRQSVQFSLQGLTFNIRLDHDEWPQDVQLRTLNMTPNWIDGVVCDWGREQWQGLKKTIDRMQEPTERKER